MRNDLARIAAIGAAGVVCILLAWGMQELANAVYGNGESTGRRIGAALIWVFSLAFVGGMVAGIIILIRATWNAPVGRHRG